MPGQTIEELRQKAAEKLGSILPTPENKSTFSFEELHEHKDDEQSFIINDLIPAHAVTMFIGVDGIGKTQLMSQLCCSVALGLPLFLSLPIIQVPEDEQHCLIVATEESRQKFTGALMRIAYGLKEDLNPKKVRIHFTEGSDFDTLEDLVDEISINLRKRKTRLVILDAMSDLFTLLDGEINSNTHARKILSILQAVCKEHDTTIIIIHHAAKSKMVAKQKEGKIFVEKDDSQGAGAITQKSRTVLALTNDPKSLSTDGKTYKNYLHVVKANLMPKTYQKTAIEIEFNTATLLHTFVGLQDVELMEPVAVADGAPGAIPVNKRRKNGPREYSDTDHKQYLKQIFEKEDKISRAKIIEKMCFLYEVGKTKVEERGGFLSYLVDKGFVTAKAGVYTITAEGRRIQEGWVPIDVEGTNVNKNGLFIVKNDDDDPPF
jgi:archaellum biogenesis ATPase FlaH